MRRHPRPAESLTAYLPPETRSVPRCALPAGRLFGLCREGLR